MEFKYKTSGVCSRELVIIVEKDIIKAVNIVGGCPGNSLGVSKLCVGLSLDDVIDKLSGIDCRGRGTSCPDQLAKACLEIKQKMMVNN